MPTSFEALIARLNREAEECDRWEARRRGRPPVKVTLEDLGAGPDPDPGFDDVAFWDDVEKVHDKTPAPYATMSSATAAVNAARRMETVNGIPEPPQGIANATRPELEARLERLELELLDASGDRERVIRGAIDRIRGKLAAAP